jgi:protease I
MKKVIALVSEDFEDLELWYPTLRLQEAGVTVDFAAEKPGTYHGKYGVPCEVEKSFKDLSADDYDGILVPGGWAPDKLRRFPEVLDLVKKMNEQDKAIGEICHAGWVLASAEILEGRTVTSTPGIKDDLRHAGATWVNEPVVVDGNIVSGRRPPDLPQYAKAFLDVLMQQA